MKILVLYAGDRAYDIVLVLGCAENSGTLMNYLTERYNGVAEVVWHDTDAATVYFSNVTRYYGIESIPNFTEEERANVPNRRI